MEIEIIYPPVDKRYLRRIGWQRIVKWVCLAAAPVCLFVNLCTGGKAWSVVVLAALYTFWTLALSPDMVEYNRISQLVRTVACCCLLLWLIDLLLVPGWAGTVVPIVCCSGLLAAEVLLFTDLERQKQNMRPLLLLIVLAIAGAGIALSVGSLARTWPWLALGVVGLASLIACAAVLRRDFLRELQRRFHTK